MAPYGDAGSVPRLAYCTRWAQGETGFEEEALGIVQMFRHALSRVVRLSKVDGRIQKQNGKWRMTTCPLGQGMVDRPKFFQILAQANYAGPVTVEVAYATRDLPSALVNELRFTRKQVETAWGGAPKT